MAKDATLIETASGPVRGIWEVNGALSWRGIPYAEPPIGDLRWKAPRRAPAHEGVLAATRFGAISTQRIEVMPGIDPMLWGTAIGSEDCLTLNVWAPGAQTNQDSGLPVMVWLHGGSNVSGSGSFFNGCYLSAQQNVVVVTLNYRLGLFGWFSHPALRKVAETELDRSPNFALLDIILALKWIRENIAAYGGNPNNVTLFGESAGAMNTMALLYSPLAKDLFHKVIMQSGGLRQTPVEVAEQHVA
ncbi:MAG: carboxylesterase family protein, partial [Gammaproteobacteria bacterium]|nr:carboxylesterase family protein [Gammaproteobacteria bacterium]